LLVTYHQHHHHFVVIKLTLLPNNVVQMHLALVFSAFEVTRWNLNRTFDLLEYSLFYVAIFLLPLLWEEVDQLLK